MRFRAEIHSTGKTTTGIKVPPQIVAELGSSKRPAVQATVNGYTWRTSVASMGGEFWLSISAENRAGADVAASDEVDIDLELDTEPCEATVPPDLSDALDRDADARQVFDGLSYSNKRRIVLHIEGAKTAETRQRRIDKAVSLLREGRT